VEETYAHAATLRMEPGSDVRAPGGAVTVALCGNGRLVGPDGRDSRWATLASGPADPGDDEL